MDHLDGTLFVDRLRGLQKDLIVRKIKKLRAPANGNAMRVVFFGTPQFAVPTLEPLLDSRTPVVGVVTQPDRPRGRGQKVTDAPVKALALSNTGCRCFSPTRLRDPAVGDTLATLAARPRRRRRVREASFPESVLNASAPRDDQRARVAAAAVSRRGAGASRGHRRRGRDRRHHHARWSSSWTPAPCSPR